MQPFFENIALAPFVSGIVFAILGSVLYKSPVSDINSFIGYRTKRSMKSQERWDFAQKHSSRNMSTLGVILIVLSALSYFIPMGDEARQIGGAVVLLIGCALMVAATETALKKKFKD